MDMPLRYYATHGLMTNPEAEAHLLASLPADIPKVCQIVQGLIVHYQLGEWYGVTLPAKRLEEVRTRSIARILARIHALDSAPLAQERPPQRRVIGCCRDYATLWCSLLRTHGIPARVRAGFATYLAPDFHCDHWIGEYWSAPEQRWIRVDAEMDALKRERNAISFDPHDVPPTQFLPAGQVWRQCRAGTCDPAQFGYEPSTSGMGVIRTYLLYDLACLNKMELIPWDFWGLSLKAYPDLTEEELALLDAVAALTMAGDAAFPVLRTAYDTQPGLRVPAMITSYTMANKKITERLYEDDAAPST